MNDERGMINSEADVHHSSFIIHRFFFLPTRLRHARDVPFESQPAEAYSAKRELAKIASAAAASLAAVVNARGEDVEIHPRSLRTFHRFLI